MIDRVFAEAAVSYIGRLRHEKNMQEVSYVQGILRAIELFRLPLMQLRQLSDDQILPEYREEEENG